MVFYKENCTCEEFNELKKIQHKDDDEIREIISSAGHKELNFIILNIGNLLMTTSLFLRIQKNVIDDFIENMPEKKRYKKILKIIKSLNDSINSRFEFDESTEIVEGLFIYEGEAYILIKKALFYKLIQDRKEDTDI